MAVVFTADEAEHIFSEYVFGFIAQDTARVIARAYPPGQSENVLCGIGLMTYTEFMGWFDRRLAGVPETRNENRDSFNHFLGQMGPCYVAVLKSGFSVWKHFRNALVHEYAVREAIDIYLPANQIACGIHRDPATKRYALWCGRYFTDFYAACAASYLRHTGNQAPPMP